jgi:uncharacterized membrane protein
VIVSTIEIGRPAEDVFAYLDEVDKHSEWQDALVSSRVLTDGPVGVGTRVADTRKVPGGPREMTYEITEHQPPRRSAWRGIDGPVRPVGSITVEPAGDARSRVKLELDLQGHGIGVLFAPLARMQASKQIPKDQAKLKEILERSAPAASPGEPAASPAEPAGGSPEPPPAQPPGGPTAQ